MGSRIEINDTLQISTEQGFPSDIFNLERHQSDPIQLDEVGDKIFEFKNKSGARLFQLDPTRVYWCHNIDGHWLAWGHIAIQEQTIHKMPGASPDEPESWATSGKYKVIKIFQPEYQRMFTTEDVPQGLSYFQNELSANYK